MELLTLGLIKYPGMNLLKECQELGINSMTIVVGTYASATPSGKYM